MNLEDPTPEEMARSAWMGNAPSDKISNYLAKASARELERFISQLPTHENSQWFHRAKVSLDIRLAEDAAKTADKMAEHTNALVAESRNLTTLTQTLTKQNATIINESKQIRFLTWGLLIFTVLLLTYTIWHDWKHGK